VEKLDSIHEKTNDILSKLTYSDKKLREVELENALLRSELKEVRYSNYKLTKRMNDNEQYSMKHHIIIKGIAPASTEIYKENTKQVVLEFAKHIGVVLSEYKIGAAHRLRARDPKSIPAIIVGLNSMEKKQELIQWSKANNKANDSRKLPYFIHEQLTRYKQRATKSCQVGREIQICLGNEWKNNDPKMRKFETRTNTNLRRAPNSIGRSQPQRGCNQHRSA